MSWKVRQEKFEKTESPLNALNYNRHLWNGSSVKLSLQAAQRLNLEIDVDDLEAFDFAPGMCSLTAPEDFDSYGNVITKHIYVAAFIHKLLRIDLNVLKSIYDLMAGCTVARLPPMASRHKRIVCGKFVLPEMIGKILDGQTVLSGSQALNVDKKGIVASSDFDIYTSHGHNYMIDKMVKLGFVRQYRFNSFPDNAPKQQPQPFQDRLAVMVNASYGGFVLRFKHQMEGYEVDCIFTRYDPLVFIFQEFDISMLKRALLHTGELIALSEKAKLHAEEGKFELDFDTQMTINCHKTKTMLSRIEKYKARGYTFIKNEHLEMITISQYAKNMIQNEGHVRSRICDLDILFAWLSDNGHKYDVNPLVCHPLWNIIRATVYRSRDEFRLAAKYGIDKSLFYSRTHVSVVSTTNLLEIDEDSVLSTTYMSSVSCYPKNTKLMLKNNGKAADSTLGVLWYYINVYAELKRVWKNLHSAGGVPNMVFAKPCTGSMFQEGKPTLTRNAMIKMCKIATDENDFDYNLRMKM